MGRVADRQACGLLRLVAAAGGLLLLMATPADAGTTYYHYDGLGRLVSVCDAASGKRIRYAYDANGNRTSWTVTTASCSANAAPVAVNDTVVGNFLVGEISQGGSPAFVTPLDNDNDPDGDEMIITTASCISSGCLVTVFEGRILKITGLTAGIKQVQYTVTDGRTTATATVTVNSFSEPAPCDPLVFCF